MPRMLSAALLLFLAAPLLATTAAFARTNHETELRAFAERLQQAIVAGDRRFIIDHLAEAVSFFDDSYSKKQLLALFQDETSWLNQDLFTGSDSVRSFLTGSGPIRLYVDASSRIPAIIFVSDTCDRPSSPHFTVRRKNGRWRITSIGFD